MTSCGIFGRCCNLQEVPYIINNDAVSLHDNRVVLRIYIGILRSSFGSPSYLLFHESFLKFHSDIILTPSLCSDCDVKFVIFSSATWTGEMWKKLSSLIRCSLRHQHQPLSQMWQLWLMVLPQNFSCREPRSGQVLCLSEHV